jgi:hypothetical protein
MKKHRGMRPQDVAILIWIASLKEQWFIRDVSTKLRISAGEVSESLSRSSYAGLVSADKKSVMKHALLEFVEHGLKYVFPVQPGSIARGMPTAHSAPPLNRIIKSSADFVWPWPRGNHRGEAVEPLYPKAPDACHEDENLHELLALVDAVRLGKPREVKSAMEEITWRIHSPNDNTRGKPRSYKSSSHGPRGY